MIELTLNPGQTGTPAGEKPAALPLPAAANARRREALRPRRRLGLLQFAPQSDGFRPFRVY